MADKAGLLKHPVPPTMDRVRCTRLLRVGPIHASVRRALLWIEEVVIRFGSAADEVEGIAEVAAQCHDDASAHRNDTLLLALAEDGELTSCEIEVTDTDAGKLGAPDAAVEEHKQGNAIARGRRAAEEKLVDVCGEERRGLPRRTGPSDLRGGGEGDVALLLGPHQNARITDVTLASVRA